MFAQEAAMMFSMGAVVVQKTSFTKLTLVLNLKEVLQKFCFIHVNDPDKTLKGNLIVYAPGFKTK